MVSVPLPINAREVLESAYSCYSEGLFSPTMDVLVQRADRSNIRCMPLLYLHLTASRQWHLAAMVGQEVARNPLDLYIASSPSLDAALHGSWKFRGKKKKTLYTTMGGSSSYFLFLPYSI